MWHAEFSSGAKSKKSLIYSSNDGTLFALNALRVACCASGLPRTTSVHIPSNPSLPPSEPKLSSKNDSAVTHRDPRAIPLPESAKTLSVLFQFILPKPPPTLQELDLRGEELFNIVTAARKYKVYTVVSIGESQLLSLAADWEDEKLFVYGITNKLPRFMDACAPAVYRDIKREKLLEICNEHGVLYAWTRYQLLWDRIIEEASAVALSSTPHGRKEREIYKHYDNLRSLHCTKRWMSLQNDPEDRPMALIKIGEQTVSYHEFLAMLDEDTRIVNSDGHPVNGAHPRSSERVSVKHINDKIKEMIKEMPTFSSFLESSQKDGDVALGQDELDSEEEEK